MRKQQRQTIIKLPVAELRDYQIEPYQKIVNEGCKRAILVFHRRAGKSVLMLSILTALALKERGNYAYMLPTFTQAKRVIWQSISNDGIKIIDMCIPRELIAKKNDSDMSITLVNGSVIQLYGAESVDRLVGGNYKALCFDEAALMSEQPWQLLRPVIKANNGTAIFISTPRSKNWFYDLWNMAKDNCEWYTSLKTYKDTGMLTDDDIESERMSGMPENLIAQEYMCDFNTANVGSYFGQEIEQMRRDGRITDFPIDDSIPVSTSWDLGISDSSAIVFYQRIGEWFYIIDEYESNGQSLKDYAKVLRDKGYFYDMHHLPHDAAHRDLSTGISRLEFMREMGINNVDIVPIKKINYGIECVHRILPRVKIHSKCQHLIKCMEMYHKEFDEKNNVFKDVPVHDWSSHMASAFRYFAEVARDQLNVERSNTMFEVRRETYNPMKWS